jgi:hypothetical protein
MGASTGGIFFIYKIKMERSGWRRPDGGGVGADQIRTQTVSYGLGALMHSRKKRPKRVGVPGGACRRQRARRKTWPPGSDGRRVVAERKGAALA